MRTIFTKSLLLFCLYLLSGGCKETSYDIAEVDVVPYTPPMEITNTLIRALSNDHQAGLRLGCLSLQLPFEIQLSDGNTVFINSEADFETLSNSNDLTIIDFTFPITTLHPAGITHTLANWEAFTEALTACIPTNGWTAEQVPAYAIDFDNSNYILSYPVQLTNEAGNSLDAASPSELVNLSVAEPLFFVFPLTLLDDNETSILVPDAEMLYSLLQSGCDQNSILISSVSPDGSSINCFDFVFPFSIELNTASSAEILNGGDFLSYLYGGWFNDFHYPLLLRLSGTDTSTIVLDNHDFNFLTADFCEDTPFYPDFLVLSTSMPDCFQAVFPINAIAPNNSILTIPDFATFVSSPVSFSYRIEFPIQLILPGNGQIVSVQNLEEILNYTTDCD